MLVEHGRWTRGVTVREDGNEFTIRRVDPECVLISSDELPNDVYLGSEVNNGDSMTIRPEDFGAR